MTICEINRMLGDFLIELSLGGGDQHGRLMLRWQTFSQSICTYCATLEGVTASISLASGDYQSMHLK